MCNLCRKSFVCSRIKHFLWNFPQINFDKIVLRWKCIFFISNCTWIAGRKHFLIQLHSWFSIGWIVQSINFIINLEWTPPSICLMENNCANRMRLCHLIFFLSFAMSKMLTHDKTCPHISKSSRCHIQTGWHILTENWKKARVSCYSILRNRKWYHELSVSVFRN